MTRVINKEKNIFMGMNTEAAKRFIRFLKEMGIYYLWLKERQKYVKRCGTQTIFSLNFSTTLYKIIDNSFTWSDTRNPVLWNNLYDMLIDKNDTVNSIIHSEYKLSEYKKLIEYCL